MRINQILAYEDGSLSAGETLDLFSDLIKSGLAWTLQGSYGRQAAAFIDLGLIDNSGEITQEGLDLASDLELEQEL